MIPYPLVASQGGSDRAVAQAMASEHCARYHKFAKITSIHRQYGDYVGFACYWSLSRPGARPLKPYPLDDRHSAMGVA
jgi:hypothetical protein